MSGERLFVRVTLTVFAVLVSLFFTPFMLVLKVLAALVEGVHVSWHISSECVRQVWAAKGIPEFDRHTKG
jgi:hypothetical protein